MSVCAHASRVSAARLRREFLPLIQQTARAVAADTRRRV
jgi:hypothetical protein